MSGEDAVRLVSGASVGIVAAIVSNVATVDEVCVEPGP